MREDIGVRELKRNVIMIYLKLSAPTFIFKKKYNKYFMYICVKCNEN